jgi:ornithine--oxo-acid transaminase
VALLSTGEFQKRARELSGVLETGLRQYLDEGLVDVRVRGLWAGVDIDPTLMSGREMSERMLAKGVLVKDIHGSTIRLAPPLVIDEADLEWLIERLGTVLAEAH